jgi:hypothetical protein
MQDQSSDSETVEVRLTVKGRPDELKIMAARWLKSNKFEALDFLAQARKSEILAEEGSTPHQIQAARLESMAFFRYLTDVLNTRIAAEKGEIPETVTTERTTPAASLEQAMKPVGDDNWEEGFPAAPKDSNSTSNDILSNL